MKESEYALNCAFELHVLDHKDQKSNTVMDAKFMEIQGLGVEIECEDMPSGGENIANYQLPKRIKRNPLILKRGVLFSDSELMNWVLDLMINGFDHQLIKKDISISLLDLKDQHPLRTWTFLKAFPIKWDFGTLKADESSLFMEEIHFTYQKLMIL